MSMATFLRKKYLHQVMQLIKPDDPCKKWNQIKSTKEKSSQMCILQHIPKIRDPSNRFKMSQYFFNFFYHLLSCASKNLICCLTCLIFLKSSSCGQIAQTHLNLQMNLLKIKIRKKDEKYFVAHQKFSKIFHGPSIYP